MSPSFKPAQEWPLRAHRASASPCMEVVPETFWGALILYITFVGGARGGDGNDPSPDVVVVLRSSSSLSSESSSLPSSPPSSSFFLSPESSLPVSSSSSHKTLVRL